ncbi:MAG: glycosyltransferase [Planctomycetes bacterium]|nr:glycosyltransferase [Planctomycetota bacterium]
MMNPLAGKKIAIVHDWCTGMRGGEKVLEVMCELFPDATLFTLLHIKGAMSETIEKMDIRTSFVQNLPKVETKYRYYLPLFPRAIEKFDVSGFDLIVSSSHCVAKGVKRTPGTPHYCYLYTPMRYVYEMFDDYFGKSGFLKRAAIGLVARRLRKWDIRTADRVDRYVAISHHIGARVQKYYQRDYHVIYPPVSVDKFELGSGKGEYYLSIGAFAPYKRVDLAIRACNKLGRRLVVVGSGQDEKNLRKVAGPTVEFRGSATDEELVGYYKNARAMIFPGIEDFGITPLESMASGRPVIALGKGGALETIKGVAAGLSPENGATGVFFGEQTEDSCADAILRFEELESRFVPGVLRKHAESFSRERFKNELREDVETFYESQKSKVRS